MKTLIIKDKEVLLDFEDYIKLKNKKIFLLPDNRSNQEKYYAYIKINNKLKSLHRWIMNFPIFLEIDHINGNSLDNRKNNLRTITHRENLANRKIQINNTSGYKGVRWNQGRWMAQIKFNGKQIYLGRFIDKKDAAVAYNNAALNMGDKFRLLNIL